MTRNPSSLTRTMENGGSLTRIFFDRLVLQHPCAVLLGMAAVVGCLAFGVKDFRLDASAETLVLEHDEDLQYARLIGSRYGQSDLLVLTYTPKCDLFSQESLATLARLRDDLKSIRHVSSVLSILDVPLLENRPVSPSTSSLPLEGAAPSGARRISAGPSADLLTLESPTVDKEPARNELRDSPFAQNLLLSPDLRTTALLITLPSDQTYYDLTERRGELRQKKAAGLLAQPERAELRRLDKQVWQRRDQIRRQSHQDILAIRAIMDRYRRDAELFLGGVSMIADDMITFIKSDLKIFGVGVLFFLVLMLGVIFRRVRWILLPTLCCVVSVVCMVGLLGWFGWEVTVISANFVSLQLIITLSIVIHLIVRYREFLTEQPEAPNRQLVLETMVVKLKPCAYAVLTTIAGFASLVLCDILPVITFGWMMIAGLIVSLIVTFLLFPAVLVLLPKEIPPGERRWRFSITSIAAGLTQKHGALIVGAGAFVLAVSVSGILKLQVENCFIDYFDETTEIYQGMKVVDRQLGGTTPLDVIVEFGQAQAQTDRTEPAAAEGQDVFDEFEDLDEAATHEKYWFTAEKMTQVKAVHGYLDSLPETGKVLSLATMVSIAEKLNGGKPLDSLELALLYNEAPDEIKALLVRPFVSVENNEVRFWVRVRDSDKTLRRNELLKKIMADLTGTLGLDRERVHLAGLLVLYNNMLQSLFGSQILTLGLTAALLTGMFFTLFRSVKIAFVAMIPNVLPVLFVLGVMGWRGIPLDMMTITIAAIGLGIAVDNTIHYIHRFKDEFPKDRRYIPTMHRCHGSIGHAMYYTSVTIIIGFSILALSNFMPSVYFGLLTGLAMCVALLAALTLLPRLLILARAFGKET